MRPFLKWAGGKYRLAPRIKALLPQGDRLIEPFVGAGAIFLNTDYSEYLLADANPDLINIYKILKKDGDSFIEKCLRNFKDKNNNEAIYYGFREQFNASQESELRSQLFIYLNRHCFNGLCRYNSSGGFNVPFGQYVKPKLDEEKMIYFHKRAQKAKFICSDFVATMRKAKAGDVVYCDPPYVPLSATSNFTAYHNLLFGEEEQIKLAKEAKRLAKKNIPVLISNHDTPFTREIYADAKITSFDIQRTISRDTKNRKKVRELLALF